MATGQRVVGWEQESETRPETVPQPTAWDSGSRREAGQRVKGPHGLAFLGRVFLHLTLVFKAQC